jgi:cobalamin biosynthesis protein CobT
MTKFTAEQKSQLAKLMATENLTVQHQKINTAKFDPINRVLYLPIWQDMSGDLYDLLCGHEVGHALYTPAQGWHDVATDKSKPKNFKSFLNVVEDARIEKKVKRRFPGLRMSFQKAYKELMERDFFGINGRDINDMAFVNRLNIYTKSQYTMTNIRFSDEEMKLVRKVESLETWDDVMSVTEEIYAYSKDEQFDMLQDFDYEFKSYTLDEEGEEMDMEDFDSGEPSDAPEEEEQSDKGNSDSSDDAESTEEEQEEDDTGSAAPENEAENEADTDEELEEEQDDKPSTIQRDKESRESQKKDFNPECLTDDEFRKNEDALLDSKSREYIYIDVPTINEYEAFTGWKRVQEQISQYYHDRTLQNDWNKLQPSLFSDLVQEFKRKNERYVSLLAKEFEMRKAAKAYSKSKVSDSGDIDISKLAGYKFDDNIFRKLTHTPKGKSHGLVLLLDCSGSMQDNMPGSIEQILVLAMFCRKVNIPFTMYGFTDIIDTYFLDRKMDQHQRLTYNSNSNSVFAHNKGELAGTNVQMREYMNSKMTNAEFNMALRNMVLLKESYSGGRYGRSRLGPGFPDSENLGNTPLIQAVFSLGHKMEEFRKVNNIDITSLIIVHDGDADSCSTYMAEQDETDYYGRKTTKLRAKSYDPRYQNVFLRDTKRKFQVQLTEPKLYSSDSMMQASLEWFSAISNSKVFGFFILPTRQGALKNTINSRYVSPEGKNLTDIRNVDCYKAADLRDSLVRTMKDEKYIVSHNKGYNEFYMIMGGQELATEEEEFEFEGKVTARTLKTAFAKFNKQKQINRVLVSRFIQGIAV